MTVSRVVLAAVFAFPVALLHVSCEKIAGSAVTPPKTVTSVTVRNTWDEHAVHLLTANRCDDLRSFLNTVPEAKINERWFRLRTLGEAMCWTHSRSARDKQSALQAVDAGIARYPSSAGLVAMKGGLMLLFGNASEARPLYDRARQMAEANLRANPNSREDRSVLADLTGTRPRDLAQRAPASGSGVKSDTDTIDIRPAWQRAAWQFMAADNCRGTVLYLNQHPLADPMWFTLRSQADLLCFQEHLGDAYKADAFKTLETGLRANPESPRLLKARGEAYAAIGDVTSAERCFQEAAASARRKLSDTHSKEEADEVLQELAMSGQSK